MIVRRTFPTELGWAVTVWQDQNLIKLTFAHPSAAAAESALESDTEWRQKLPGGTSSAVIEFDEEAEIEESTIRAIQQFVERLQDYAQGSRDDFQDVPVQQYGRTDFQCQVLKACRAIPWGETRSYGQLAAAAGSPRAARAVGNIMAGNHLPIVIPCHRVVAAHSIGGFSAPAGLSTKRRLLALEGGWEE